MSEKINSAKSEKSAATVTVTTASTVTAASIVTTAKKPWPENCPWPEPVEWSFHYDEDTIPMEVDEETDELLEIKEYFDSLVESGRLNEDYSLNEDYDGTDADPDDADADPADFTPSTGADYWDDGFDYDLWLEDISNHINLLKIAPMDPNLDPILAIRPIISYDFINENLLRQAFTRRSFSLEYGLSGCSEELEFLGDSVLNTVVTREIMRQFTENDCIRYDAPFRSKYNEGELTKLRQHFTGKDYLSNRAKELDLGKYILYATGETENDSALEDMMEALIGAVVIDCGWDMTTIEKVVNELLCIQLDTPDSLLKKSYYDILNAWHQSHFGRMPIYEVHEKCENHWPLDRYYCDVRFSIPDNDKDVHTAQRLVATGETRSKARESAARSAYDFIVRNGLWKNLAEAGIVPDLENSINQLQELFQKKYLDSKPEYEYEERSDGWYVSCRAESYHGWGKAGTKVKAKKKAAYMLIVRMLRSAGICDDDWTETTFRNIVE